MVDLDIIMQAILHVFVTTLNVNKRAWLVVKYF